jgi:hypothetical protein
LKGVRWVAPRFQQRVEGFAGVEFGEEEGERRTRLALGFRWEEGLGAD